MPSERRTLTFSRPETLKALQLFQHRHPGRLPPGRPVSWRRRSGDGDEEVGVSVQTRDAENGGGEGDLAAAEVAVALMFLCDELGIPLPRDARKQLEVGEDEVVFRISVD
jgi:hypothetical protein